jgi:REP element-mobilizing transposase RayT
MANTYTKIYIHCIFSVKNKLSLIRPQWKEDLFRYISGIVENNNHKMIAINGMSDHLHLFIGMKPTQSLSDLMQDIKGSSSRWIHEKRYVKGHFEWQAGFGAFSYSVSQIEDVVKYIQNQEQHHKTSSFIMEYIKLLNKFQVPYDERYIFTKIEE